MKLSGIIIIVLALLIIVALAMLYKTRKSLREMDGFRSIKEPEDDDDDDVIDSFGE